MRVQRPAGGVTIAPGVHLHDGLSLDINGEVFWLVQSLDDNVIHTGRLADIGIVPVCGFDDGGCIVLVSEFTPGSECQNCGRILGILPEAPI